MRVKSSKFALNAKVRVRKIVNVVRNGGLFKNLSGLEIVRQDNRYYRYKNKSGYRARDRT